MLISVFNFAASQYLEDVHGGWMYKWKLSEKLRKNLSLCLLEVQTLSHAVLLSWVVRNRMISVIYLFSCLNRIVWCWEYRKPQGCLAPVIFGDRFCSASDFGSGLPNSFWSHCMVLITYFGAIHTNCLRRVCILQAFLELTMWEWDTARWCSDVEM